jgi:hypothetical protein
MNYTKFKHLYLFVLLVSILNSCQDNEVIFSNPEELSLEARNFFGLQNSMQMSSRASGNSGSDMLNRSFGAAKAGNPEMLVLGKTKSDSTLVSIPPFEWVTCAQITEFQNSDGSTTSITDYGDGCKEGNDEFRYFMRGKLTWRFKNESSLKGSVYSYNYSSQTRMENFGGSYIYNEDTTSWLTNGKSSYSSSSAYDTLKKTYTGNYSWSDSSKHGYRTYGKNLDTYVINSNGKVAYNESKSVTSTSFSEYYTGSDYYSTTVIVPLVMDYSCNPASLVARSDMRCLMPYTYVSGRERISYNRGDISGSFEVDYGDGTCDTIITIYENGKVFKIDVFEDYQKVMDGEAADGRIGG